MTKEKLCSSTSRPAPARAEPVSGSVRHESWAGVLLAEMRARQQELARESHDSVASSLAAVSLLLGGAQELANAATARLLLRAQDQTRHASEEVRNMSRGVLGDIGAAPLVRCLQQLAQDLSSSGRADCAFQERGRAPDFDLLCRTHGYRVAQEAMTNAIRHGEAKNIRILLIHAGTGVSRLVVRDDGRACDFTSLPRDHSGMGLKSMQARTARLRGRLVPRGRRGMGCTVKLTWRATPIHEGASARGAGNQCKP